MQKNVFVTGAVTDSKSTDVEGVGTLRWVGSKLYRWVQNKHTSALALGDVCFHDFSNAADLLEKVYDGATADLGAMAGVVASTSIAADEYGWVQVLGIHETAAVFASETTAKTAGDVLKGVDAQVYADADVTMGTAPTHPRNLQLLEAVATVTTGAATSAKVYVNCL